MSDEIKKNITSFLKLIDPDFEHLKKTPERVTRACEEFFSGYKQTPTQITKDAIFDSEMDQMIILKKIPFESHCEHHVVPIIGEASVGYTPNKKILGASKLARIVDCFASRLQLQERMTMEIAQAVNEIISPISVAVYIEAEHFCISRRGVKKNGAKFVTKYFIGTIKNDYNLRSEFLSEVKR
ncbi:MAG: GTP cyclohydrolase I FolE [Alphaproteobacteria bacterium]|nr:GTP cyclohydrolase I FolE [Alphaproteobacteria bacterium]